MTTTQPPGRRMPGEDTKERQPETVRPPLDPTDFVHHLAAKGDFPNAEATMDLVIRLVREDEQGWEAFIDPIDQTYDDELVLGTAEPFAAKGSSGRRAFRPAGEPRGTPQVGSRGRRRRSGGPRTNAERPRGRPALTFTVIGVPACTAPGACDRGRRWSMT